jgi:uncharacterized membrane protein
MEFSIGSAVRFGWETFKRRPWIFVGSCVVIALAYLVAGVLVGGLDAATGASPEQPSLIGSIADLVLGTFVGMGLTAFYLKAHDDVDGVTLSALWHPQPFWSYLGATILMTLGIILGIILLIVPGVIVMLMWLFTTFVVVDRGRGPIEALGESRRITYGYKWRLLGFVLVLALINIAGAVALLVGLLVSIPVTMLAFTHAYRVLSAKAGLERAVPDASLTSPT